MDTDSPMPRSSFSPLLPPPSSDPSSPSNSHSGHSSFWHALFNCFSLLLGLGMLASPYAVQTAGWSIIFLSLFPVPLVYFYTAILLKRCLDKFSDLRSYDDIAEKAFGKKGLVILFVLFYLEIYSCLVSYAVSIADNLVQIVSYQIGETGMILSNRWFLTSLAMLVVLPMTWLRDLRALSFTSMGSTITVIAVILCVIWVAIVGGNDIAISTSNLDFIHPAQVPVSTSIFLFCYSGHIVLPSIYLSMKDRTKFTKAITTSFSMATICYGGLGLLGAFMFGDDVNSQVTLNLPSKYIASMVASWLTLIVPITKFALLLSPVSSAMDRLIPLSPSSRTFLVASIMGRTTLTFSVFLVALLFPFFSYILALIGSTFSVSICIIFPCLLYLRLMRGCLSRLVVFFCICLILISFVVGVICTTFSIRSYVEEMLDA